MNSTERRKQLLAWLDTEGNLSISEITERFKVSKMTVHRDLTLLENRQALRRIHGGALANPRSSIQPDPAGSGGPQSVPGQCLICFRSATQHLVYNLTLRNGESRLACCPHCGVSAHLQYKDQVVMALTADYLTGRQHPVHNSTFLMGSVVAPCCQPSILTFENEEMARRFQDGFGGRLGKLQEALEFLQHELNVNQSNCACPNCSKG